MDKKTIGVISFTILIIFVRIIFWNQPYIAKIVGIANLVAALFVLYGIIDNTIKGITCKIEDSGVPVQIAKREIMRTKFKIIGFSMGTFIIVATLYILFFCTDLSNDIISFATLGISFIDEDLAKSIIDNYRI